MRHCLMTVQHVAAAKLWKAKSQELWQQELTGYLFIYIYSMPCSNMLPSDSTFISSPGSINNHCFIFRNLRCFLLDVPQM
jgi:hypothetical protein